MFISFLIHNQLTLWHRKLSVIKKREMAIGFSEEMASSAERKLECERTHSYTQGKILEEKKFSGVGLDEEAFKPSDED